MEKFNFLNNKKIKVILQEVYEQWGIPPEELKEYIFMQKKENLFITTEDIRNIKLEKLRINSIGIYFGEYKHNKLRPSIEGSQIIGKFANKNVLEIQEEDVKKWLMGKDLEIEDDTNLKGYLIIKHGKDFLGSGMLKDKKILNFVPKSRRLKLSDE
jgi:NOL1/NOP2/fmu family ribosome biogenesis protein